MASSPSARLYRLDKFKVPAAAREEFLGTVRGTHYVLQAQPGFVRDFILEQSSGSDASCIVTLVEWEDESSIAAAKSVVTAAHARMGVDPKKMLARLGIEMDLGVYQSIGR